MTVAWAESLLSDCIKRKVGAVIARITREEIEGNKFEQGFIVSSGYNDVPIGTEQCIDSEGYEKCARDKLQVELAEKNKEHIALISQFDRRFEYSGSGRIDSKEREKIMEISDPKERQAVFKLVREKSAKQAMKNLEEAVRRYIKWTRTQGI